MYNRRTAFMVLAIFLFIQGACSKLIGMDAQHRVRHTVEVSYPEHNIPLLRKAIVTNDIEWMRSFLQNLVSSNKVLVVDTINTLLSNIQDNQQSPAMLFQANSVVYALLSQRFEIAKLIIKELCNHRSVALYKILNQPYDTSHNTFEVLSSFLSENREFFGQILQSQTTQREFLHWNPIHYAAYHNDIRFLDMAYRHCPAAFIKACKQKTSSGQRPVDTAIFYAKYDADHMLKAVMEHFETKKQSCSDDKQRAEWSYISQEQERRKQEIRAIEQENRHRIKQEIREQEARDKARQQANREKNAIRKKARQQAKREKKARQQKDALRAAQKKQQKQDAEYQAQLIKKAKREAAQQQQKLERQNQEEAQRQAKQQKRAERKRRAKAAQQRKRKRQRQTVQQQAKRKRQAKQAAQRQAEHKKIAEEEAQRQQKLVRLQRQQEKTALLKLQMRQQYEQQVARESSSDHSSLLHQCAEDENQEQLQTMFDRLSNPVFISRALSAADGQTGKTLLSIMVRKSKLEALSYLLRRYSDAVLPLLVTIHTHPQDTVITSPLFTLLANPHFEPAALSKKPAFFCRTVFYNNKKNCQR